MRRGLMAWDKDEIPIDVLRRRVHRLQAAMAKAGQDALLLYTNFIRSGAVSYLTAFSPYWADGVLLVPHEGEPLFATTLSKRVGSWIQTVKPVGDLINSPAPGKVLGEKLAASGVRRVAILELDNFPSGLYDDVTQALSGVEIVDGTATFAAARSSLDIVEQRLLERADAIAQESLKQVSVSPDLTIGAAVGSVERQARLKGAEEVYVAIAPDLDADGRFIRISGNRALGLRFAIRATVAYKGSWVRRTQSYSRDDWDRSLIARADAWFQSVLSVPDKKQLFERIARNAAELPNAPILDWIAETSVGTRPLSVIASMKHPQGALQVSPLILSAVLTIDGVPWYGAGLAGARQEPSA